MPGSKLSQFNPVHKMADGRWFCDLGMHAFVFRTGKVPVDCPDRHRLREVVVEVMDTDMAFKLDFLAKYPRGLNSLSVPEVIELVSEIQGRIAE